MAEHAVELVEVALVLHQRGAREVVEVLDAAVARGRASIASIRVRYSRSVTGRPADFSSLKKVRNMLDLRRGSVLGHQKGATGRLVYHSGKRNYTSASQKRTDAREPDLPLNALFVGDIIVAIDEVAALCASMGETLRPRAQADSTGDVVVHSGADAIEAAAPAWRALEQAGGAATPFQCLAVARAAAAVHLARGERPHIAVACDGDHPVAILPGVIGRSAGVSTLRFLGDPLIQYGDVIASPEARRRISKRFGVRRPIRPSSAR